MASDNMRTNSDGFELGWRVDLSIEITGDHDAVILQRGIEFFQDLNDL
jgi:hypothetical protein